MGTAIKHPERQSARMSKITNDGLTRPGIGCFIAVPMWHHWASKGFKAFPTAFFSAAAIGITTIILPRDDIQRAQLSYGKSSVRLSVYVMSVYHDNIVVNFLIIFNEQLAHSLRAPVTKKLQADDFENPS